MAEEDPTNDFEESKASAGDALILGNQTSELINPEMNDTDRQQTEEDILEPSRDVFMPIEEVAESNQDWKRQITETQPTTYYGL